MTWKSITLTAGIISALAFAGADRAAANAVLGPPLNSIEGPVGLAEKTRGGFSLHISPYGIYVYKGPRYRYHRRYYRKRHYYRPYYYERSYYWPRRHKRRHKRYHYHW